MTLGPFLFALLSLFSSPVLAQNFFAQTEPDVPVLSRQLEAVAREVQARWPEAKLYIGGGSGRAFVDAALLGKPLRFRDLDLQILTSAPFSESDLARLEPLFVEKAGLSRMGVFNSNDHELFLTDGRRSVDISFFENKAALDQRGIYDIDTIKVVLPEAGGLRGLLDAIRSGGYDKAVRDGLVYDPLRAYPGFREGRLVLLPEGRTLDFVSLATRTARTYGKMGFGDVPGDIRQLLETLRRQPYSFSRKSWAKHLLKVLADDQSAREVKWLAEFGLLAEWSPEISRKVLSMSVAEIASVIGPPKDIINPLDPYRRLTALASADEQLRLIGDTVKIDKPYADRWRAEVLENGGLRSCSKVF